METDNSSTRLPRRTVLQWIAAAAAVGETAPAIAQAPAPALKGYGTDPKLTEFYEPGAFWPLTFSESDKKTVTALVDVVLPADDLGPAASEVRVPDYIDEWISAPYESQQRDRKIILSGLKWLDKESQTRYKKPFAELSPAEQTALCDIMAEPEQSDPKLKKAAKFFSSFISIAMGAYYGTTEGWKAIGYAGNTPSIKFDGPPQDVLDLVGVEQTVS